VITLYHCAAARSFRPLWALEELGLSYELKMLPFPPRVFAREYLALNPLGTVPLLVDGDTRMTESAAILILSHAMARRRFRLASMSPTMAPVSTGCTSARRR